MKWVLSIVLLSTCLANAKEQQYEVKLDKPAENWREAMPMGNGRMGAMVEGGIDNEVIHLNEDTLWSGEPQPHYDGTKCRTNLHKVRELIFNGEHAKATALGNQTLLGEYNQCYQPLGQLKINFPGIDKTACVKYSRILNLNIAVTTTTFQIGEVTYTRETFISYPDQALIIKLTASKKGSLNASITLSSLLEHDTEVNAKGLLVMQGRTPIHADPHYLGKRIQYDSSEKKLGMRFCSVVKIDTKDGVVTNGTNRLVISKATECVIKLTARTSYNGFDKSPSQEGKNAFKLAIKDQDTLSSKPYKQLLKRHVEDHNALFSRVSIQLGNTQKSNLVTTARLGRNYVDGADPDLDEMFYQFGRYLLIASSREGSQPANLQGIWSYKLNPSWSANWTINCNAQFNYIGSGAAGLSGLNEPYLRMIEEGAIDGAAVSESWYGTKGWVIHHNLDLWRSAMPVGGNVLWATFPAGGTWCVVELYDNWKFNPKMDALKRINRLQKGNAQFWLDNLQKHPKTGKYVSSPDVYFENAGRKKSGEQVVLCSGPVSSTILIKQSFLDYIESCKTLKLNNATLITQISEMLKKMPAIEINKNGELRQWHEDFDGSWGESDSTQLLAMVGAIYSNQIHPELSPKLANALMQMLEKRKNGLDGQASWRAAFPANTYARLGQGDLCKKVIAATYRKWINPNMTARFIQADWEIDGNLGLMGAMQECLIQSHTDELVLLPALPEEWAKSGTVKGMKARGGFSLDFSWKDGKVTEYRIYGRQGRKVTLRIDGKPLVVKSE